MSKAPTRVVLSWSSGKDSAWCLHILRQRADIEVVALLTTFNHSADRVAMHAVRRELVQLQAQAAGLPLIEVELPWPCSNRDYESALAESLVSVRERFTVSTMAFGDLFLEDIRHYRDRQLDGWGFEALYPLWQQPTRQLAQQMLAAGMRAILTCVDPRQCPGEFAGRQFDQHLLEALPEDIDPCGENGEFHTFVTDAPVFSHSLKVAVGETQTRDGFIFTDVTLASASGLCC